MFSHSPQNLKIWTFQIAVVLSMAKKCAKISKPVCRAIVLSSTAEPSGHLLLVAVLLNKSFICNVLVTVIAMVAQGPY